MRPIIKKVAAAYAVKKGFDAVQRARSKPQPPPRRISSGKVGAAAIIAVLGGAGVYLARSGRLPKLPDLPKLQEKIGRGGRSGASGDPSSDGDARLDETSTITDRPM